MARPTRAFDQSATLFARPGADTGICAPTHMTTVTTAFWLRSTTWFCWVRPDAWMVCPPWTINLIRDPIVLPWPTDKKAGIHAVTNVINEIAAPP